MPPSRRACHGAGARDRTASRRPLARARRLVHLRRQRAAHRARERADATAPADPLAGARRSPAPVRGQRSPHPLRLAAHHRGQHGNVPGQAGRGGHVPGRSAGGSRRLAPLATRHRLRAAAAQLDTERRAHAHAGRAALRSGGGRHPALDRRARRVRRARQHAGRVLRARELHGEHGGDERQPARVHAAHERCAWHGLFRRSRGDRQPARDRQRHRRRGRERHRAIRLGRHGHRWRCHAGRHELRAGALRGREHALHRHAQQHRHPGLPPGSRHFRPHHARARPAARPGHALHRAGVERRHRLAHGGAGREGVLRRAREPVRLERGARLARAVRCRAQPRRRTRLVRLGRHAVARARVGTTLTPVSARATA